jgi:hypothetical protein
VKKARSKYPKTVDETADESRFGIYTLVVRILTACGIKPIGKWQWLFKAFWLYGSVEPATGESFFLQFSDVDTECFQRYLKADLRWVSFKTLEELQIKVGQLLAALTPEIIASITGYPSVSSGTVDYNVVSCWDEGSG